VSERVIQKSTRNGECVVGRRRHGVPLNPVLRSTEPKGAALGEQAALIRETGVIFHHLQKIALFERFFCLKLKRIGWQHLIYR
jgi:hypothetical protein